MRSMRRRSATALSWDFFERGLKQGRSSAAEQAAAVDRAGMTVFRSMKVSRPARQLSFNVRRILNVSIMRRAEGRMVNNDQRGKKWIL
jgi:hypothetical protein